MIQQGSKVKWKWGRAYVKGKVLETYTKCKTLASGDTLMIRHGRKEDKAVLIEQEDSRKVLKLESELENQNS